ncbi:hypothetical protein [uncultured Arthrobacter sp.]|uniref:hypothetical protein n=1 Tax=uncultured Arthrobacter sp. TaxID=114050 RepID=UPI0025F17C5F|nr:hypothetical protein [uncultured Arthrobacter sp.]
MTTPDEPSVTRLDGLREMRDDLRTRMSKCDSDQNFAVMGRLLADTLKQIDELDPPAVVEKPEDDVDEFTRRLRERESGTAAPRKAKG